MYSPSATPSASARYRWSCKPSIPGIRTSRIRQFVSSTRLELRNSWADEKAAALKPKAPTRYRVEFAIEAFNTLNLPLRVIGSGPEEGRLRSIAKRNVVFVGRVDDATLAAEYSEARAVVFPPYLEYGLIPLEANACGTPVIAARDFPRSR